MNQELLDAQKQMSYADFEEMVSAHKGVQFISFKAVVFPKVVKKNVPPGIALPISKHSHVNGLIGYDYENSVNNQRGREGHPEEFVAEKHSWGTRINRSIVKHTPKPAKDELPVEKTYLTVKVQKVLEQPLYFDGNGKQLTDEQIRVCFPPKDEGSRQELDQIVIHREYSFDSLFDIAVNKQKFLLVP